MKFKYISDLKEHVGETIELRGWVHNKRSSGKIRFLVLRDGTGFCQCVFVKAETDPESFEQMANLDQESCIAVTGVVREEPRSPVGYEIGAQSFRLIAPSQEFPISPKEHGIDFLMSHRHLWLRSKKQHAMIRVRAEVVRAIRDFFDGRGFTLTDAPIFTPSACEGTTTLFETQYFDTKAFLSQSGQLYMEATAAAFGKVYCFGPTFRAEKSKTRRHLIEFWMVEPEVAFADLNDNMDLAEEFVEYIIQRSLKNLQPELKVLERDTSKLETVKKPFPRMHYKEAVEKILKENPDFKRGDDFGAPDETILSADLDRPLFVYNFPAAIKAFYMKQDPDNADESLSCDLIAPEGYGEIIGGGQREDDLSLIEKKIDEHQLSQDDFKWFLDLRRYGSFPHSGFGLGLERTVAWICGSSHLREVIPFPRLYGRNYP